MIYTERQIKWSHENRSRKSPEQVMNFQGQHYEHKPYFDYQVEYLDNEHETHISSNPGKVGPECGICDPEHCLVERIERV
jgi:hypothetical protein